VKVIVFGATGSIGRLTVQQLLDAGHEVTAFTRKGNGHGFDGQGVRINVGQIESPTDVSIALEGQEAALITLGSGKSLKNTVRSAGTLNIINGMQQLGVERLICQSTLGTHESWNNLNFFWKRIMFGGLLKYIFADHELQELLVRASGLNWTIVRPSAFTDEKPSAKFKVDIPATDRGLKLTISRCDVAAFLTSLVNSQEFKHRAVGISN